MDAIFLNCWRQTLLLFLNILSSKDKVYFLRKILEGRKILTSLPLETLELGFYPAQIVKSGWHLSSKSSFILEICWKKQFKNHSAFKPWPSQMAKLNTAHSFTPARNLGDYTHCCIKLLLISSLVWLLIPGSRTAFTAESWCEDQQSNHLGLSFCIYKTQ